MLYHLAQQLQLKYSFFNLFHYVSVRAMGAFLGSIALSFLLGNWFIRTSQRNFKSKTREWTPKNHQKKNNTPTMGGLFILMIFLLNCLFWNNLSCSQVWIFLLGVVGFGIIGFFDDWHKIKRHKGISASIKFSLQITLAFLTAILWYFLVSPNTHICIPFFKNIQPELGWILIPWSAFIIIGTSNAVNLTDGLDGLATGPLIFNFSAYSVIAYLAGHKSFAAYLYIPYAESAEITILAASFVGVLLGFLWYNTYPAQIFMGDIGSLMLGTGLALVALMSRQELLLPICAGIFVVETISVIIQVISFKIFKKRMFKMAPMHHHFELKGWPETKITVRFWIISIILSVLTLLILKIR
jgi:phospho-N-acetylmuramoyl-pentapeptide-transferase